MDDWNNFINERFVSFQMLLLYDKICALKYVLENKAPGEDRDKLCRFRKQDGPLIAQREGRWRRWDGLEIDETMELMRMKWTTIYDDSRVSHLGNPEYLFQIWLIALACIILECFQLFYSVCRSLRWYSKIKLPLTYLGHCVSVQGIHVPCHPRPKSHMPLTSTLPTLGVIHLQKFPPTESFSCILLFAVPPSLLDWDLIAYLFYICCWFLATLTLDSLPNALHAASYTLII